MTKARLNPVGFVASGIFIGSVAHILIGISLVWDKVLLRQRETRNVVSYVFWLGFLSFVGVFVAVFGFHMPSLWMVALAISAGILHMISVFFYYLGLKRAEASSALAIMGGFAPVATALIAIPLLDRPLGGESIEGFVLMVFGGFIMFFTDVSHLKSVIPLAIFFAATGGLSNVVQKMVFDSEGFTSGYVFFTLGSTAGSALLLLRPTWREQIFRQTRTISSHSRWHYLANRGASGLGSILVYVAISRTSPAIIDAISGLRYVVIFLMTYLITEFRPEWLSEEFSRGVFIAKSVATALVIAGLVLVGLVRHPSHESAHGSPARLWAPAMVLDERWHPSPVPRTAC